ncbi:hypothetical protein [Thermosulfurimonas sp. F29]|uniref:hypothetical protein n=1 Tax=Thermosulfurimonas sp. F29 TaxID=2867247 RepID=UPI001C82F733|nr:hypothetical protein [Thermosulfurimonas sp. F29]MBX6423594.1 hypothetical protein [Thermosulfurimonas sp. F29]
MRVALPAPVTYLPESLFSLLGQPGRELTVRVVEVEGKTLTLETGGERFQARLAGSLLPADFRAGATVRVRVLSAGPPVLLQLVEGPGIGRAEEKLTGLLQFLQGRAVAVSGKLPAVSERPAPETLAGFLVHLLSEKTEEGEEKHPVGGRREAPSPHEEAVLLRFWREGQMVLPFFFADRFSWGFLEVGREEDIEGGERFFYVRVFLSELGLMEAFIRSSAERILRVNFFFSRDEALNLARKEVLELRRELAERGFWPEITLERSYYEPGIILAREG